MAYETLHKRLNGPIQQTLLKELSLKNVNAVPKITKVVVNVGINKSKMDSKETRAYIEESLGLITGQKPVFTKARQAISNFKTRTGMVVGAMVTLRGPQMEAFLDRLISYALPRVRDFRGLSHKLDGHGNYNIGIADHSIFPEVPMPDAKQIFGMQVQITTNTDSDEEAKKLLELMGMPFRPQKKDEEEAKKAEAQAAAAEAKKAAEEEAREEAAAEAGEAEGEAEDKSEEGGEKAEKGDDKKDAKKDSDAKKGDESVAKDESTPDTA